MCGLDIFLQNYMYQFLFTGYIYIKLNICINSYLPAIYNNGLLHASLFLNEINQYHTSLIMRLKKIP